MPSRRKTSRSAASSSASGAVRRRLPISEKRRIVELTTRAGASIRAVAREHGINRHSLYQWRALYNAGKLVEEPGSRAIFLPVSLSAAPSKARDRETPNAQLRIEVVLPSGAIVRIESSGADRTLACAVLAQAQR